MTSPTVYHAAGFLKLTGNSSAGLRRPERQTESREKDATNLPLQAERMTKRGGKR
jgi:hypothetical protein